MPVTYINQLGSTTFLIVWEITESNAQLQELLHNRLNDWNSTEQNRENKHWLASRLAILHHFKNEEVDLIKDEFNKPHLKVDDKDVFVSISHSFDKAAVIIGMNNPVALDIERIDKRIDRVQHKFCNNDELNMAQNNTNPTTVFAIIWAAKETMYKWYGKKEIEFKTQMMIEPFDVYNKEFLIRGRIKKHAFTKELAIKVRVEDGYVMTFVV